MQNKAHEEYKQLYIERAEEQAKHHGLYCEHIQYGTWITMKGWETARTITGAIAVRRAVVVIKARGWKNASDQFVAAVTEWAQNQGVK